MRLTAIGRLSRPVGGLPHTPRFIFSGRTFMATAVGPFSGGGRRKTQVASRHFGHACPDRLIVLIIITGLWCRLAGTTRLISRGRSTVSLRVSLKNDEDRVWSATPTNYGHLRHGRLY